MKETKTDRELMKEFIEVMEREKILSKDENYEYYIIAILMSPAFQAMKERVSDLNKLKEIKTAESEFSRYDCLEIELKSLVRQIMDSNSLESLQEVTSLNFPNIGLTKEKKALQEIARIGNLEGEISSELMANQMMQIAEKHLEMTGAENDSGDSRVVNDKDVVDMEGKIQDPCWRCSGKKKVLTFGDNQCVSCGRKIDSEKTLLDYANEVHGLSMDVLTPRQIIELISEYLEE